MTSQLKPAEFGGDYLNSELSFEERHPGDRMLEGRRQAIASIDRSD